MNVILDGNFAVVSVSTVRRLSSRALFMNYDASVC